jgi:hypothetical protein
MTRGRLPRAVLVVLAVLLVAVPVAARADDGTTYRNVRLSAGFHYSAGDYDTSSTTEIFYVPFTLRVDRGHWSFRATVPYLKIQGGTGVVEGPTGPVTSKGTADGLGDVTARGGYWIAPLLSWMPWIELDALVKFPTADEDDGLGTGRFDFGVETEWTWLVDRFAPFVVLGYRFLGDRPSLRLHDVFAGSVGAQYLFTDSIAAGLMLDYREKASATSGERVELIPFASFRIRPHWILSTYVSAGLAAGSPDVGVGLEAGYVF